MTPTPEQTDAVDRFRQGGALKINAFAGTGKTTTLRLLATSTDRQGMYLAFNKAIAADAKSRFPANVACSTVHSIAFRATPQAFRQGDKMTGSMNANAVAKHLDYKDQYVDGLRLTPRSQGHLTLETLRKFMQGGRDAADERHVPLLGKLGTLDDGTLSRIRTAAVQDAMRLWRRMCDPRDSIPLGHDGYLKLWAISRPTLPADFVLLDEAQDTNPVVLEMLRHQTAQIVYVGDRHQQIYEWRGAVNAMERIRTPHETHLTTSFRFGPSIADAASQVIARLGETRRLTGNATVTSYLSSDAADAIVARTNASVISSVLREMGQGRRPHVVGGTSDLIRMLRGVEVLKQNQPSDVSEFFGFANWGEVVEHSKVPEGESLRTFVKLVEEHGETRLIGRLNETAQDERGADVVVSTAHKAKGREWDTVSLAGDFLPPQPGQDPDAPPTFDPAEIRLFYVALTRAKIAVDVPPADLAHFGVTSGPRFSRPRPQCVAPQSVAPKPTQAVRTGTTTRVTATAAPARENGATNGTGGILAMIGRWIWLPIGLGVLKLLFGWVIRRDERGLGMDVMSWDVLGGQAKWPMTNVRNLSLPQWRRLAERPDNRCLVPLTEFCEWTPDTHDVGGGRPIKGEMWFRVTDQPLFAAAGFWQPTEKGAGFAMVTCNANEMVAPIHPKAMITILEPADHERWLTGGLDVVVALQRPYDAARMTVRGPVFPTRRAAPPPAEPTLI